MKIKNPVVENAVKAFNKTALNSGKKEANFGNVKCGVYDDGKVTFSVSWDSMGSGYGDLATVTRDLEQFIKVLNENKANLLKAKTWLSSNAKA